MPDFFYRFRATERLLGKAELERQEIFFCAPDKLNDPIEGFKDIVWQGDTIVWRSLLKNYVMTLLQVGLVWFSGDPGGPDFVKNAVRVTPEDIADTNIRAMCAAVFASFLQDPAVTAFVTVMAVRDKPVRRHELLNYLRALHPFAAVSVAAELVKHGVFGTPNFLASLDLPKLRANAIALIEASRTIRGFPPGDSRTAETAFAAMESTATQVELIGEYLMRDQAVSPAIRYFMRYFTTDYIAALDGLVHPDWYVACFSADPLNAAMWGTYGHGHRGVCLKFRATPNSNNQPALPLRCATGMTGDQIIYGYVPFEFRKIEYEAKFPIIDFFRTLGGLRVVQLAHFWYRGDDGAMSTCREAFRSDEEAWRKQYWQNFAASSGVKTNDWHYEQEYRLVQHSFMFDLRPDAMRLLSYKFEDLAGIVFGARTALKDKIAIMEIVERKCVAAGRTDFEFSEIRYAPESGAFYQTPLSLIRIKLAGLPASEAG